MTRRSMRPAWVAIAAVLAAAVVAAQGAVKPAPAPVPPALPTIILDTVKGPIEIELFRPDAPKSVDHLLALVKRDFYRGLRFHRVEKSLVQFGDPLTRDMTYRDGWGSGGSGQPIGVVEISRRHLNVRGAVGLAYSGAAADADSQLYIMKVAGPSLDGKYAVVGQVTKGMDVVDRVEYADVIKAVTLKSAASK